MADDQDWLAKLKSLRAQKTLDDKTDTLKSKETERSEADTERDRARTRGDLPGEEKARTERDAHAQAAGDLKGEVSQAQEELVTSRNEEWEAQKNQLQGVTEGQAAREQMGQAPQTPEAQARALGGSMAGSIQPGSVIQEMDARDLTGAESSAPSNVPQQVKSSGWARGLELTGEEKEAHERARGQVNPNFKADDAARAARGNVLQPSVEGVIPSENTEPAANEHGTKGMQQVTGTTSLQTTEAQAQIRAAASGFVQNASPEDLRQAQAASARKSAEITKTKPLSPAPTVGVSQGQDQSLSGHTPTVSTPAPALPEPDHEPEPGS